MTKYLPPFGLLFLTHTYDMINYRVFFLSILPSCIYFCRILCLSLSSKTRRQKSQFMDISQVAQGYIFYIYIYICREREGGCVFRSTHTHVVAYVHTVTNYVLFLFFLSVYIPFFPLLSVVVDIILLLIV